MNRIVLACLVIAIVAGIGLASLGLRRRLRKERSGFRAKGKLLSDSEQDFLRSLEAALQGRYRIATKVSLLDVISPQESLDRSRRVSVLGRMGQTRLDFVLCDSQTSEVLAAIWLDDRRRRVGGHVGGDGFLETALHSANIHLIRIEAQPSYAAAHLAAQIESVLTRDFIETLTLAPAEAPRLRRPRRERCNL